MTELDEKDLDQVDAYHRGELNATEEAELRSRIARDPEFAVEVLQQERLLEALKPGAEELAEREAFKASFKARQELRSESSKKQATVRSLPRWVVGAAAALLIGVIGYWGSTVKWSGETNVAAGAVPYFTPLNRLAGRMGNEPATEDQLTIAYDAYDTGDYATAAPLLNSPGLVAADSLNLLYGAVAELGLGNAATAIPTLEMLRETRFYAEYQGEIDFYLGVGYLEVGEREKALQLFLTTSNLPGFYGEESKEVTIILKEK